MLRFCVLFLLITATNSISFADTGSDAALCETAMAGLNAIDPRFGEIFQFIEQIDPKLISSEKLPGWKDIEDLKAILVKLKDTKQDLQSKGELETAIKNATQALAQIRASAWATALQTEVRNYQHHTDYKPTEYDLKRLYENLLIELNRELPVELRVPLRHLPYDVRHARLLKQAEDLVRQQTQKFLPYFSSTGFSNLSSYRAAVKASGEKFQQLLNQVESDYEFAMNRPEGARWWVPKVGFQNTATVGNSGAGYYEYRDRKESARTQQKLADYKLLDPELKPEYGYLKPKPSADIIQSSSADGYGSDTYIFKREKVRNRVTWTQGNSEVPTGGTPDDPQVTNWEDFCIPFQFRALAVPGMYVSWDLKKLAFDFTGKPIDPLPEPPGQPNYPFFDFPPPPPLPAMPPAPPKPSTYPTPPPKPSPYPTPPAGLPEQPVPTGNAAADAKAQADYQKATNDYYTSPAYVDFEKDDAAFEAIWQQTPDYQTYQAALTIAQKEYMESPAYVAWSKACDDAINAFYSGPIMAAYNKQVQILSDAWNTGPEMKKYNEELKAYEASPAYVQYLQDSKKHVEDALRAPFIGTPLESFRMSFHTNYFELQYWGPVDLDDVEIFEFKNNPPSDEFLGELKKRNIKIRDARVQPAVDWVETK